MSKANNTDEYVISRSSSVTETIQVNMYLTP